MSQDNYFIIKEINFNRIYSKTSSPQCGNYFLIYLKKI